MRAVMRAVFIATVLAHGLAFGGKSLILTNAPKMKGSGTLPYISRFAALGNWRVEGQADHWVNHGAQVGLWEIDSTTSVVIDAANRLILNGMGGEAAFLPLGTTTAFRWVAQRDLAAGKYTLEIWDQVTGVYKKSEAAMTNTTTMDRRNWHFAIGSLWEVETPDIRLGFVRWYSTNREVGGQPPLMVPATPADLLDFEFEGNLKDTSPSKADVSFDSGVSYEVTAAFPPAINLGPTPMTVRAGTTATLDATASFSNSDSPGVSCVWQQLSVPERGEWSDQNTCTVSLTVPVFGSYTIRIAVTDSEKRKSTRDFKIGSVSTDDNGIVVVPDPRVSALLGPLIMFCGNAGGCPFGNSWPYADDRARAMADYQIDHMETWWKDFWNTASTHGSVSVTNGSATVTGEGTQFQTDFCGGAGNTEPATNGPFIAIWYPSADYPGTAGRAFYRVTACQSQTQLTVTTAYVHSSGTSAGLSYTVTNDTEMYPWIKGNISANYYDNVLAFYALYYRTGLEKYRDAARTLASRFWTGPNYDRGKCYDFDRLGGGFMVGGPSRSQAPTGLLLWSLDTGADIWPGMHYLWGLFKWLMYDRMRQLSPPWHTQAGDLREDGYITAGLALCASYDTDATWRGNCLTALKGALNNFWVPLEREDHAWVGAYPLKVFTNPGGTVYATVQNGSRNVTLTGDTWQPSTFTAFASRTVNVTGTTVTRTAGEGFIQKWGLNKPMWVLINGTGYQVASVQSDTVLTVTSSPGNVSNAKLYSLDLNLWFTHSKTETEFVGKNTADVGDTKYYRVTSIPDETHLVLNENYSGCPDANPCQKGLFIGVYAGYINQPYMQGLATGALGTYVYDALMNAGETTDALTVKGLVQRSVSYLSTVGYDASARGMYYARIAMNCEPVPNNDSSCESARVLVGEAIRAYSAGYQLTGDPAIKSAMDNLYSGLYAKPGWATPVPSDGTWLDAFEDPGLGYSFMDGNASSNKWFGFFFGYGFSAGWPAARAGGLAAANSRTISVPIDLASAPRATQVRITVIQPNRVTSTTLCRSARCTITVDARQGDHLWRVDYLSDNGTVVQPGQTVVLPVRGRSAKVASP